MERKPIRRALLSVSDKRGLLGLASALIDHGADLVATSSTAAELQRHGIEVQEVSELTGFPEILGGRVKTLHPVIHGGLLARQDLEDDLAELGTLGIAPFDAVIANLYPFTETLSSGATADECIEMIDIGGPTMVRAAAKNHADVAVVTSPYQYAQLIEEVRAGGTTLAERTELAVQAFQMIADYDIAIANWMTGLPGRNSGTEPEASPLPDWLAMSFSRELALRYGENPHQAAALFKADLAGKGIGLAGATQLGGKPLSYNNFQDTDAALKAATVFSEPTIAIIKHANPCGLASADTIAKAYREAFACDPMSAFGGVVASNREVDADTASQIAKVFTEVVAAPSFTAEALEILQRKPSLRILEVDAGGSDLEFRQVSGGLLVQESDTPQPLEAPQEWTLVAGPAASPETLEDLDFAWRAVQFVKSNAILLAKDTATVGVGMGQVNRVDSAKLAVQRANTLADGQERAVGAVAASDAFFPFADGLQILTEAGVTAIVSPGGSKRDQEVIDAAQAAGVTLYFTGVRHFWH